MSWSFTPCVIFPGSARTLEQANQFALDRADWWQSKIPAGQFAAADLKDLKFGRSGLVLSELTHSWLITQPGYETAERVMVQTVLSPAVAFDHDTAFERLPNVSRKFVIGVLAYGL